MRSVKIPRMRCGLVMALVTATGMLYAPAAAPQDLTFEVRAFNGPEEVTGQTRLTVHRAGDRTESLAIDRRGDGRVQLQVPPGIYDVQALHEREGKIVNIRWANRLLIMPYPDERGHHLEVINFRNGFGALQVRSADGPPPALALYEAGKRTKPAALPLTATTYTLFVVPAGQYDLQVRDGSKVSWMPAIDVPLDRTRLTIVTP